MTYEFLDHTADLKIRAVGQNFEDALSEAAKALFNAIAPDSKIKTKTGREFIITVHKPQILVHDFLGELLEI